MNIEERQNIDFEILNNKLPSNLSRKIRKLKKKTEFSYLKNSISNSKKFFDEIINLKIKQYDRTGARNIFSNKVKNFYKYFINNNCLIKPFVSIILDENKNRIISGNYSLIYNNTFFWLFPVYNNKYKYFSPGQIYLKNLFDELKSDYNLKEFDFGAGNETYKINLSNNVINLFSYYKSLSLKGLVFKIIYGFYYNLKNNHVLRPILMKLFAYIKVLK